METVIIDLEPFNASPEHEEAFKDAWKLGAMTSWAFAVGKLVEASIHDSAHFFMDAGFREWGEDFIERANDLSVVPEDWRPPYKDRTTTSSSNPSSSDGGD